MNKQAILKRAKQDPEFRHRVISRLRKKEAAGRTLNQMMIPVFAKYLSNLPKLLAIAFGTLSKDMKWDSTTVSGTYEGKKWFIQWNFEPPNTDLEIRCNFGGASKNIYIDTEDNTLEEVVEEILALLPVPS